MINLIWSGYVHNFEARIVEINSHIVCQMKYPGHDWSADICHITKDSILSAALEDGIII